MQRRTLTDKQQAIFDYVRLYLRTNGMPPTRKEIATRFRFDSLNSAQQHLRAIEKKGYIRLLNSGISRGIQIL